MIGHRLDTRNALSRQGYARKIVCLRCGQEVEASAVLMLQQIHANGGSLSIEEVEQGMKCSHCDRRGVAISPAAIGDRSRLDRQHHARACPASKEEGDLAGSLCL